MREKLGAELMRAASRFAIIGMVGGMTAACSTDRFASAPFSNPFSSGSGEPSRTGSVVPEPTPAPAMPRSSIESQPLAPIRPITSAPAGAPSGYSSPSGHASPAPSAMPARPRTAAGTAGWSTTGGTTVIVGPGETLTTLTSRYGVPAEAILSSNGLKPSDVTAGKRVVIPVYSATEGGSAPAPARRAEVAPAPVRYNAPPAPAHAAPRVVASQKIEVRKEPPRTVAEAAPPKSQLRPGKPVVAKAPEPPKEVAKPATRVAEAKKEVVKAAPTAKLAKAPEPIAAKPAKVAKAAEKEVVLPAKKLASAEPAKPAKVEAPQKVAAAPKAERTPVREPESTASIAPAAPIATSAPAAPASTSGSSADFRWPARGRVINGFGGGGGNEGINIAVPEGTPVKAAGDGVVAYAGSEVKGYGNLVLIRHDNGYVSAYANNGQLDVKRGQRVSRGQSIAKSGQTGNVTSPQLHFEIRKGSTPVDPMKYLASAE